MIFTQIPISTSQKNCKALIAFDDMIPVMLRNRKFTQVVSELFFCASKLNVHLFSLYSNTSLFQKIVTLNLTPYFIMIKHKTWTSINYH